MLVGLLAVEDGAEHIGHGRLALGARDADDLDVVVGSAEGLGGGIGHGGGAGSKLTIEVLRGGGLELVSMFHIAQVGHGAVFKCGGEDTAT